MAVMAINMDSIPPCSVIAELRHAHGSWQLGMCTRLHACLTIAHRMHGMAWISVHAKFLLYVRHVLLVLLHMNVHVLLPAC